MSAEELLKQIRELERRWSVIHSYATWEACKEFRDFVFGPVKAELRNARLHKRKR